MTPKRIQNQKDINNPKNEFSSYPKMPVSKLSDPQIPGFPIYFAKFREIRPELFQFSKKFLNLYIPNFKPMSKQDPLLPPNSRILAIHSLKSHIVTIFPNIGQKRNFGNDPSKIMTNEAETVPMLIFQQPRPLSFHLRVQGGGLGRK